MTVVLTFAQTETASLGIYRRYCGTGWDSVRLQLYFERLNNGAAMLGMSSALMK